MKHEHDVRAGFTLLEALIAVTILGIVLASVGFTSQRATDALDENTHMEDLVRRVHRALDQAIEPLQELELAALPPLDDGADAITYHLPTGWAGGVQWGPNTLLALEYDPGELDDDVDNDGDGLVDEGWLVRTLAPGTEDERRVVLCKNVSEYLDGETFNVLDDNGNGLEDERGFSVDVRGDVLTVRLTLESLSPDGRILRRTATSSVRVRN